MRRAYQGMGWKGRRRKRRENRRRAALLNQALGIEVAVHRLSAGLRADHVAKLAGIRSRRYSDIEDGHGVTACQLEVIATLFATTVPQMYSAALARIDEGKMPSRYARDHLGEALGYTRPDDWFDQFRNDGAPTAESAS